MFYLGASFSRMTKAWRWAEEIGYEAIYVGDHLWSRREGESHSYPRYDGGVVLAALAGATSRVTIGSYVASMENRHPAVVAKQAITLDHLSAGRLHVGLGAGGNPRDLDVIGVSPSPAAVRSHRFAEYVTVVRGLLERPEFDFAGRWFSVRHAVRNPRPLQQPRPPITVAAHSSASLKIAAEHADTWSSYGISLAVQRAGIKPSPAAALAATRVRSDQLDTEAIALGRDPTSIRRSLLAGLTGDNPWDSEDAFRDFIGRYVDVGINEFVFPCPLADARSRPLFDRVSRDVLPELRASYNGA